MRDIAEQEAINRVALLAEGVDRNYKLCPCKAIISMSPSLRRAWIEIALCYPTAVCDGRRPPCGGRG